MRISKAVAVFALAFAAGQTAHAATVYELPSKITLVKHQYVCNYCYPGSVKPVAGIMRGLSLGLPATGIVTLTLDGELLDIDISYGSGQTLSSPMMQKLGEGSYMTPTNDSVWWLSIDWATFSGNFRHAGDGTPFANEWTVTFSPTTVPLPASAALLPIGIAALSLVRRRRKSDRRNRAA